MKIYEKIAGAFEGRYKFYQIDDMFVTKDTVYYKNTMVIWKCDIKNYRVKHCLDYKPDLTRDYLEGGFLYGLELACDIPSKTAKRINIILETIQQNYVLKFKRFGGVKTLCLNNTPIALNHTYCIFDGRVFHSRSDHADLKNGIVFIDLFDPLDITFCRYTKTEYVGKSDIKFTIETGIFNQKTYYIRQIYPVQGNGVKWYDRSFNKCLNKVNELIKKLREENNENNK